MGGSDWARATARVKRAVKDMAGELVRLYTVRMSVPGHAFGPDTPWQHELEDAFPHEETGDQLVAIDEVKHDMEQPKPMDRLICGDVGFGKTEIAIRAAFKAVMEGKQVAVLVPTTLLAEQHFITFGERFAPFPVTVTMLIAVRAATPSRSRSCEDAKDGKVDVVIGTHRLLGKDVAFKDLGLLVVDEEQRFGVAHKERLKQFRAQRGRAHDDGDADPAHARDGAHRDPRDVDDRHAARGPAAGAHLRRLVRRGPGARRGPARAAARGPGLLGAQPRRDDRPAGRLAPGAAPRGARSSIAHGQMDEDQLERQMMRFWDREADVLVCIDDHRVAVSTSRTRTR